MKINTLIYFSLLSLITITAFSITLHKYRQKPRAILVGACGKQGQEYFHLLKDTVEFTAFIVSGNTQYNTEQHKLLEMAQQNNIAIISGVKGLKKAIDLNSIDFTTAFIAIPHHLHEEFTSLLLASNKIIIKEKPLALTYQELYKYSSIAKTEQLPLLTIVQRHFQSSLVEAKKNLHLIGIPLSFSYEYSFDLPQMTAGWRADHIQSGGGVVIDMGYHIIDVVHDFFGMPDLNKTKAIFSFYHNEMLIKKLEDEAIIDLTYLSGLHGTITLSRHKTRNEKFIIHGTLGSIEIDPMSYEIRDKNNTILKSYKATQTKQQNKLEMLTSYLENRNNSAYINRELTRHKGNVAIIDHIYTRAQLKDSITQKIK